MEPDALKYLYDIREAGFVNTSLKWVSRFRIIRR